MPWHLLYYWLTLPRPLLITTPYRAPMATLIGAEQQKRVRADIVQSITKSIKKNSLLLALFALATALLLATTNFLTKRESLSQSVWLHNKRCLK